MEEKMSRWCRMTGAYNGLERYLNMSDLREADEDRARGEGARLLLELFSESGYPDLKVEDLAIRITLSDD